MANNITIPVEKLEASFQSILQEGYDRGYRDGHTLLIVKDKDVKGHGSYSRGGEKDESSAESLSKETVHHMAEHVHELSERAKKAKKDKVAHKKHKEAAEAHKMIASHHKDNAKLSEKLKLAALAAAHSKHAKKHEKESAYHTKKKRELAKKHRRKKIIVDTEKGELKKKGLSPVSIEGREIILKALRDDSLYQRRKKAWIEAKAKYLIDTSTAGSLITHAKAISIANRLWKKKQAKKAEAVLPIAEEIVEQDTTIKAMPEKPKIVLLSIAGLTIDADRLQYKSNDGGEDGLSEERRQEDMDKPFDIMTVPPIAVWQAPHSDDTREKYLGQVYVVDGHKRYHHAKAKGVPTIRGFFIEASSFEEAKKIGKEINND